MSSLADLTPGVWNVDTSHSVVGFSARHLMISKVRGRFTDFSGTVTIAEDPLQSIVEANVDLSSVTTGDDQRDAHLKSADFFDIENHPTATFRSTAVAVTGSSGTVDGDLTIKGVSRPVRLQVEYLGHATDPWGNDRAVFSAGGKLNREDWGLTWNMLLETGGLLVSKDITLELEVELIRQ